MQTTSTMHSNSTIYMIGVLTKGSKWLNSETRPENEGLR